MSQKHWKKNWKHLYIRYIQTLFCKKKFHTLSLGGCGGQGCYFQPNQRVISQISTSQECTDSVFMTLKCTFDVLISVQNIRFCVETPCRMNVLQGKCCILLIQMVPGTLNSLNLNLQSQWFYRQSLFDSTKNIFLSINFLVKWTTFY